jgi:DNA (cytosine-5)-methyltransferase 1
MARFDGTVNFGLWKTRVKDLLTQQGIWRALDKKKPVKVDDDKWEEMQVQACAMMRLCLADQIMYHVMDESSPKKIWDKLAEKFMSKTLTQKLYLK